MRRMFAIIQDSLMLAPENATYSHKEWFEKEGWTDSFDEIIRGYTDETGVYFYAGDDFHATPQMVRAFLSYLEELVQKLSIDQEMHLFAGLQVMEGQNPYPPDKDMGKIKHLVQIRAPH